MTVGGDWFECKNGCHAGGQPQVDVVKNGLDLVQVNLFGIGFFVFGEIIIGAGGV